MSMRFSREYRGRVEVTFSFDNDEEADTFLKQLKEIQDFYNEAHKEEKDVAEAAKAKEISEPKSGSVPKQVRSKTVGKPSRKK